MTQSPVTKCPKCSNGAITLASGRIVCKHCGYSDVKEDKKQSLKTVQKAEILNPKDFKGFISSVEDFLSYFQITNSKVFFIAGFLVMLWGLGMDTTVSSQYSLDRTHNIGRLNTRSNIVNVGGFLMLSGAILGVKESLDHKGKDE